MEIIFVSHSIPRRQRFYYETDSQACKMLLLQMQTKSFFFLLDSDYGGGSEGERRGRGEEK